MANIDQDGAIFVGKSSKPEFLTLALANRHGLVTGATGTGGPDAGAAPCSARARAPGATATGTGSAGA